MTGRLVWSSGQSTSNLMNDEDLYVEDQEEVEEKEQPETQTESEPKEKEYPSELVARKALSVKEGQDLKPGDTFTFEVVKDFGDEVEIRCSHKKKSKSEDEELSELASDNY